MDIRGYRLDHPAHLPADQIVAACGALALCHRDDALGLWLTDCGDPQQLENALSPGWAGLVECSAPIPDKFRHVPQPCQPGGIFLLITTRTAHECDLAAVLAAACRWRYQPGDDECMDMELALQEAVANAILHGNLELDSNWRKEGNLRAFAQMQRERLADPHYSERLISITCYQQDDCLAVQIVNEGDGFDWQHAVHPQRLQADCARGLSLIHRLSRETIFQDRGCSISMLLPLG